MIKVEGEQVVLTEVVEVEQQADGSVVMTAQIEHLLKVVLVAAVQYV